MYIVTITNLENFSREVQYYKLNRYVVLAPHQSITLDCDDSQGLIYYKSLGRKKFNVSYEEVKEENTSDNDIKVETINKEEVPNSSFVNTFLKVLKEEEVSEEVVNNSPAEEAIEEIQNDINPIETIPDKESSTDDIENLSDNQLKLILKNLGVSTSARARWKLVDLVKLNLPDEANIFDYLK